MRFQFSWGGESGGERLLIFITKMESSLPLSKHPWNQKKGGVGSTPPLKAFSVVHAYCRTKQRVNLHGIPHKKTTRKHRPRALLPLRNTAPFLHLQLMQPTTGLEKPDQWNPMILAAYLGYPESHLEMDGNLISSCHTPRTNCGLKAEITPELTSK